MRSPRRGPDGELHLTEAQERYLEEFILKPEPERPCSKLRFAEQLGVDPKTLRRWERDVVFVSEWRKRLQEMNVSPEATQPIIEQLRDTAIHGRGQERIKAAELYLKYVAQISPPQKIEVENVTAKDLSDEELAEAAKTYLHAVGE